MLFGFLLCQGLALLCLSKGLGGAFVFTLAIHPPPQKKVRDYRLHGTRFDYSNFCDMFIVRPAQFKAPLPHVFIMFQKIHLKPAKSAYSSRSKFRRVVEALRLCHARTLGEPGSYHCSNRVSEVLAFPAREKYLWRPSWAIQTLKIAAQLAYTSLLYLRFCGTINSRVSINGP